MNEKGVRCLSPNQCIDNLLAGTCKSSAISRAREGPLCSYFIVHVESSTDAAYSADFGYWPLIDENLTKHITTVFSVQGSTEHVRIACIVFCRSIQKYIGYFYVVGGTLKASEADTAGIQLPQHWNTVCRVSWVRVAPLALSALRTQPQYLPQNIDLELLMKAKDGQLVDATMGVNLCSLIDRLSTIRSMSLRDRSVTQTGRALYTLSSSNSERQNRPMAQMK